MRSLWENSHCFSEEGDWKQDRDPKTGCLSEQPERTAEAEVERKEELIFKERHLKITGIAK